MGKTTCTTTSVYLTYATNVMTAMLSCSTQFNDVSSICEIPNNALRYHTSTLYTHHTTYTAMTKTTIFLMFLDNTNSITKTTMASPSQSPSFDNHVSADQDSDFDPHTHTLIHTLPLLPHLDTPAADAELDSYYTSLDDSVAAASSPGSLYGHGLPNKHGLHPRFTSTSVTPPHDHATLTANDARVKYVSRVMEMTSRSGPCLKVEEGEEKLFEDDETRGRGRDVDLGRHAIGIHNYRAKNTCVPGKCWCQGA
ncbi:hypothetical protein P280DRAFT_45384 [Massarina eburnea CBS 473.64]|uniref:Uncharacterized protein n=1 Tax=Massarina eburnea CBS 473.64 TaxID=1395130 RepID=A0A6A6S0F8_9PLEO|nr:hypothetical protein P280DRAFT_45384 [Massarina eburnea CBS 473.64]